eukprot:GILJ01012653.1.p1 GENE.GILJ01012653.1~~GILJ01012653.1.p1  ORF type:complete len:569 (+),score=102.10 GILJ01012653.1:468-2174(+)
MSSVGDVAADAKIATGSKVMLYEMSTKQLLATSLSISLLNAGTPWDMFETPDREMNAAAKEAVAKCSNVGDVPCTTMTYLTTDSVISVHYVKTETDINMLLLQVTPEYYFFGESRKTRLNGILVGAGAAVVVVITCIIIWLAVYRPINTLQDNMELAANMQNDKAEGNSCFLYEIAVLNDTFERMNNKLLQARAFLPQALLVGTDGQGDEMNDDGDDDDEGHLLENSDVEVPGEDETSQAMGRADAQSHRSNGSTKSHQRRAADNYQGNKKRNNRGDNASDTSSLRSMTKQAPKAARYTLALSRAITSRRIGVLIVNGRDFHRLSAEPNANVTQLHQELVELVEGSSKAEKGVVDSFQGDHFAITFNAAMAVGAPAKGAALCAIRIQNSVTIRTGLPGVTMGLSTGLAMVGSLGSNDMKKFCMVTPAYSQAIALEVAAKQVIGITSCLFSMKIAGDLDTHIYSQLVGQKYLCGTNINALEGKIVNVGGVMGAITTQGDEWLYELEEGASKNPYSKINGAFELFFANQRDRCADVLASGYPENATDPRMIANWHRLTDILRTGSSDWQL